MELLSLCLLCVLVSTVLHHWTGAAGWRRLLWGSTVVLVGGIAWMCIGFAAYGVGACLAPAALLALLAAWTSRRSQPQPPALPTSPLSRGGGQAGRRSRARALQLLSGVAAGFIGLENIGIAVFAPLANQETMGTSCVGGVCTAVYISSKVNNLETGFIPLDGLIIVALPFFCVLGIALSAVFDRYGEDTSWPSILLFSTILLAGFVVWTALNTYAFFFGVVLVPAVVFALVATFASLVGHARAARLV
jgi:hypothetical protein